LISFILFVSVSSSFNGLWRTFGHETALATDVSTAKSEGYTTTGSCNANLGILYCKPDTRSNPFTDHPLCLYFTSGGQIAGIRQRVSGSNKEVGNAAPTNLVNKGYWKVLSADSWAIDISFRSSQQMCSGQVYSSKIGDQAVINQDTIKVAIPITALQARAANYTRGSCMKSMGQHHFYDLSVAPKQSWDESNLLPVVPMYNPPDSTGVLNAFFIATPVAQPGSNDLLFGAHDWEAPSLSPSNMCQNWCDGSCTWKTPAWSTGHIYLNSAHSTLTCPGASSLDLLIGRTCPTN